MEYIRLRILIGLVLASTKGFFSFGKVAWRYKPLYALSSMSLVSWGCLMMFENQIALVYPIYSVLPGYLPSILYLTAAFAWPILFFNRKFKAARMSVLAQGLVHIANGINFLPSVLLYFPGAMTGATIYIGMGLALVDSWRFTPEIISGNTYAVGESKEPS